MNLRRGMLYTVLAFAVTLVGCVEGRVHHGAMVRGQILDIENGMATISIGSQDGVRPGQMFEVRHYTHVFDDSSKNDVSKYSRSVVGSIQITEVIDANYSRAQVASGKPSANDVVELKEMP